MRVSPAYPKGDYLRKPAEEGMTVPQRRLIPDPSELRVLVATGWTHAEIADLVHERTGHRVTRGAVSSAICRAGLSAPAHRYKDHLPWQVKVEHSKHYAARMLQLLGRRDQGGGLSEADSRRLDAWLAKLEEENAIVAYAPQTEEGFFYVKPPRGYRRSGIPILRQEIRMS